MACVLHFTGDAAEVRELELLCPTEPCAVFRKGEPRSARPGARPAGTSGISVVASEADIEELELQQAEALVYLKAHHDRLLAMRSVAAVEAGSIDFGIAMRDVIVPGDSFEPDLLAEIASLRMRLVLSQYPPVGKAKKVKQYRRSQRSAA